MKANDWVGMPNNVWAWAQSNEEIALVSGWFNTKGADMLRSNTRARCFLFGLQVFNGSYYYFDQ